MKLAAFTLIWMFIPFLLFAQEPTNSMAKQAYTGIKNSLDKLNNMDPSNGINSYDAEIEKVKKNITKIEKYEPAFDISTEKNKLNLFISKSDKYKKVKQEETENKKAIANDADHLYQEMLSLFRSPHYEDFKNEEGISYESILLQYDQKCDSFLKTNPDLRIKNANENLKYVEVQDIEYEKGSFDAKLAELKQYLYLGTEATSLSLYYFVVKKYEIYWKTLSTTFPNDTNILSHLHKTNEELINLGTDVNFENWAEQNKSKNKKEYLTSKAVSFDPKIIELFKIAFENEGWNETIKNIILLDTYWHVNRNPLTGEITGRYQSAEIEAVNQSGTCLIYTFTIQQDFNGKEYNSKPYRLSHGNHFVNCN